MCGIAGFLNRSGERADPEIVARMSATLVHRGPDDSGLWVDGPWALAHRRLSIIDVSRGHQPMALEREPGDPLHIVYNGEVYNHASLRKEIGRAPERYATHCDTETVLAAYAHWGEHAVTRFRGMFAFAVHDARSESLFLARDRLGIKPLYYFESPRLFAFASEIKALLAHPEIEATVDEEALPIQLALKYTLDDRTLYRGIRKLPPGHTLRLSRAGLSIDRYWDLSFEPKERFASFDDAADAFGELFRDSVAARLMSDVPLGVFLSGGIDSSAIAAAMAEEVDEPIRSFSINAPNKGYDESAFARAVSSHTGSRHREVRLTAEDWFAAWPRMVFHEDEPIAHPSSISLHFVSQLAAEDVKVVLTGEGADELMAGYERYYQTLYNLQAGRLVPAPLRRLAGRALGLLPERSFVRRKARRTSLVLEPDVDSLLLDNYAAFARPEIAALLRPEYRGAALADLYRPFDALMEASDARELLDRILYADIKTYLLELLMKQDQMSMSASLESRVPFLDHPLVEFVARLPVEYKLRGFETKRVLRRAVADTLPQQILKRPKMGFPTPTRAWFRDSHRAAMEELLLADDARINAYCERDAVRRVLQLHASGRRDLEEQIWTLGNLELWLRIGIEGTPPEEAWPAA